MTPEQFCYWLNGFAELTPELPDEGQWALIREHLAATFKKETPQLRRDENWTLNNQHLQDRAAKAAGLDTRSTLVC